MFQHLCIKLSRRSEHRLLQVPTQWPRMNVATHAHIDGQHENITRALQSIVGAGVEFNAQLDTIQVISEAVFTANHLTDTDKQNSTGKYKLNTNQKK